MWPLWVTQVLLIICLKASSTADLRTWHVFFHSFLKTCSHSYFHKSFWELTECFWHSRFWMLTCISSIYHIFSHVVTLSFTSPSEILTECFWHNRSWTCTCTSSILPYFLFSHVAILSFTSSSVFLFIHTSFFPFLTCSHSDFHKSFSEFYWKPSLAWFKLPAQGSFDSVVTSSHSLLVLAHVGFWWACACWWRCRAC